MNQNKLDLVIRSIFQITHYNFNQLTEIRGKALNILDPIYNFPVYSDDIFKCICNHYGDENAIEKSMDIMKILDKNQLLISFSETLEKVKTDIIELKNEYKSQKITY